MQRRRRRRRKGRRIGSKLRWSRQVESIESEEKNKLMNEASKYKKKLLIKQGWEEIIPTFDFNYLLEIGPDKIIEEAGFLISAFSEYTNRNPMAFLGWPIQEARNRFVKSICPSSNVPPMPVSTPSINAQWPLQGEDNSSETAFEELTYRTIVSIIGQVLNPPDEIYQYTDNFVCKWDNPKPFSFADLELVGKLRAIWHEQKVDLLIESTFKWGDNERAEALVWSLYSKNLRSLSSKALINTGIEINPHAYQVGTVDSIFKLNSFPEDIKSNTADLIDKLGFNNQTRFKDNSNKINYPERFNVLVVGPPGYGKSTWTQAFAAELLAPLGYLIMVVDYSSMQSLVLPNYLDKVCIIINDVDTLCLSRDISERGQTEQIMAWLDGTRGTFIKPFYLNRRTSVITLMTANSVEKWDEAALRQGRIHQTYLFDKVNLSKL